MEYVGFGIFIKNEIFLSDIIHSYVLGIKANSEKRLFPKLSYLKRIVSTLTNKTRPRFWHILLLNRILKKADLIGKRKPEHSEKDPIDLLNELIDKIAGIVGITQTELMRNCTPHQLEKLYYSYIRQKMIDEYEREKTLLKALVFRNVDNEGYKKRITEINNDIKETRQDNYFKENTINQIEDNQENESFYFNFKF